jgi:hypothetical protein
MTHTPAIHHDLRHNRKEPKDAILRQWTMLRLIPSKPQSLSTQQIQQKLAAADALYAVHRRTIERNLMALMAVFPELDYESSPQGNRWYFDASYSRGPVNNPLNHLAGGATVHGWDG